jgi:hypothetical protein
MRQTTASTSSRKNIQPEYVGVDTAEAMTDVSRWTWRRWAYGRKIASIKLGKRLLIPVSEIRRVVEEGLRPSTEVKL